jgi:hypothetical protein
MASQTYAGHVSASAATFWQLIVSVGARSVPGDLASSIRTGISRAA